MRSINQQSHSTETLNRTITFSASGQASFSGTNVRSASASGAANSSYDSQWEDHWWSGQESWASGGTYQNTTYDDYTLTLHKFEDLTRLCPVASERPGCDP